MTYQKTALITGAAERIGAVVATHLHHIGYNIAIHYRHSDQAANILAENLNQKRPLSAAVVQADLNQHEDISRLEKNANALWGNIDVLINNASSFYPTPIGETTEADWNDLINSNVKGAFFLSQALAPTLATRNGSIINMVDIHAQRPLKSHTVYCLAKAALTTMTISLAKELAPNVRVNGIAPGAILWPSDQGQNTLNEQQKTAIIEQIPLARPGAPTDIARTAAFLAEDAPYITGQIIAVDGGRSL